MNTLPAYEMIIGLETHAALQTAQKAFCSCENRFGATPNTLCCPLCAGMPQQKPRLNPEALRLSLLAGLALHCQIQTQSQFDRKHYHSPDLPKGYQCTQFFQPLCLGGYLDIEIDSEIKHIPIRRIHLEEDAGRMFSPSPGKTAVDLNRAGVPLIEIVTEPVLRSGEEAVAYLRALRTALSFAGVSDCKMSEGSLRCDVNISLRKPGESPGVRTELKNLASFRDVERAIAAEYARQAALLAAGQPIAQETRRFDDKTGLTYFSRPKENEADYRYTPDSDLPPILLTAAEIEALRQALPPSSEAWRNSFIENERLSDYAARQLAAAPWLAAYYQQMAKASRFPVAAANLLLGEVLARLSLQDSRPALEKNPDCLPVSPRHLARLSDMLAEERINSTMMKEILSALLLHDTDPEAYAQAHGLWIITEDALLLQAIQKTLAESPSLLHAYHAGKTNVLTALMGKSMAQTGGKAHPQKLRQFLLSELEK